MSGSGPKFADREGSSKPERPPHTPSAPVVYEMGVDAVRALDRAAIDEYGIPGIVLMENAALGILPKALAMLEDHPGDVSVLCGPGNNGGDGLALARHLVLRGVRVEVGLLAPIDSYRGDAAINLRIALRTANTCDRLSIGPIASLGDEPATLVVDALFGTGLTRALEGAGDEAVRWIAERRSRGASVLSIDVPSGLDADTGEPLGTECVQADATVALAAVKPGLSRLEAQAYVGELSVAGIGVPEALLARFGTHWTPHPGSDGAKADHQPD